MTDTALTCETRVSEPGQDEGHLVCCEDDDGAVAFCGLDVSGMPWGEEGGEPTCVVCADLSGHYCPRYGKCPQLL